ncbi:hypothetical protein M0Q28_04365 [Patescibacteria group bacterium]|jgi:hypothetical protein|nr:hypothetical protein [Patescibacteria group bacterium]
MRRRNVRSTRRSNPLRKRLDYPMVEPRGLADQVEGGCTVQLIMGASPSASRLEIAVRFKGSIYDHNEERDEPLWESLRVQLWIGFDGAQISFPIVRVRAMESTLTLSCRYPGEGTLDRIRKVRVLRLAPSADPRAGVLLEVRDVLKTVRNKLPPKSRKG